MNSGQNAIVCCTAATVGVVLFGAGAIFGAVVNNALACAFCTLLTALFAGVWSLNFRDVGGGW